MVSHTDRRHIIEIHIAEYTAHTEHVLTFQVRTVTPAEYLHSQPVLSGPQIGCQIKLGYIVRSLRIAYILSVQIYQSGTVDTTEVNECTLFLPSLRQIEEPYIRTHRIDTIIFSTVVESLTRIDVRRRIGVRIFHVGINRMVIPLHFPVRRNRNGFPTGNIEVFFIEVYRTL